MTPSAYGDLVACLPQGRTLFRYGHGQFAPMLLRQLLLHGWMLPDIRTSRFAKLLDREIMRPLMASAGKLKLEPVELQLAYPTEATSWRLSVGCWSSGKKRTWRQTARLGSNVVLQLNFCREHDAAFDALFGENSGHIMRRTSHPVSQKENTLAWARLDVDIDEGAVLIEEIQSDWVRDTERMCRWPINYFNRLSVEERPKTLVDRKEYQRRAVIYGQSILPRFTTHWQETMLAACQFFAFEELGVDNLFMHTFETGNLLKGIDPKWGAPPRSIYSDLPRRMGFERGTLAPNFLSDELTTRRMKKAKDHQPEFWRLSLNPANANRERELYRPETVPCTM